MAKLEAGAGELAWARKRRRLWRIAGGVGLGCAGLSWLLGQNRFLFGPTGSISPMLAISASIALAAVFIGGAWLYFRETDELDLRDNLIAGSVGFGFYVLAFPIWITLSRADLVQPPNQEIIYVASLFVCVLAYCWKRWRP